MPGQEDLRTTPLDEAHRRAGGRMAPFAGWSLPTHYSGVMEEHRAVRRAAGLFDVSHMGEIEVSGSGAEAFLQSLTPNDVSRLAPGRAHYSGLLTEDGTYVDDLLVYRLDAADFLLVVNAANRADDLAWVSERAPADVTVRDRSDDYALLALQGPEAVGLLGPLCDVDLTALKYYRFAHGSVAERPALVSRTGYTGEDGFELYVAPTDALPIWDRLLEAGEPAGLVPAGLGARDTLRLEACMALYGHEIDRGTTPFEAGLDWVVKLHAGEFVGREALLRQRERGSERRLIGFEVVGRGIARQGHSILIGGEPVGAVTSGTFSPTLEKAIGMGYVPTAGAVPGADIEIEVRGRKLPAVIADMPFYRRPR